MKFVRPYQGSLAGSSVCTVFGWVAFSRARTETASFQAFKLCSILDKLRAPLSNFSEQLESYQRSKQDTLDYISQATTSHLTAPSDEATTRSVH